MFKCKYCGKPTKFLRFSHDECAQKHKNGKQQIIAATEAAIRGGDISKLAGTVQDTARDSYISSSDTDKLIADAWENALDEALADNILSQEEEKNLSALVNHCPSSGKVIADRGGIIRISKASLLRRVINGEPLVPTTEQIPFNLQKSEELVCIIEKTKYYTYKTRTQYVGGSQGVGIRVAKGLYFSTGSFRGERVQTTQSTHADTGVLGITTKHIYFSGATNRFRVPYAKIVSFEPHPDGIEIQKDSASAKPQRFATGDGWFIHNLVVNLAQR